MSNEDRATPRPWQSTQYGTTEPAKLIGIVRGDTTIALLGNSDHQQGNIAANARMIVRAVNAHDKLVEALERYVEADGDDAETNDELHTSARAALSLARGAEQ